MTTWAGATPQLPQMCMMAAGWGLYGRNALLSAGWKGAACSLAWKWSTLKAAFLVIRPLPNTWCETKHAACYNLGACAPAACSCWGHRCGHWQRLTHADGDAHLGMPASSRKVQSSISPGMNCSLPNACALKDQ